MQNTQTVSTQPLISFIVTTYNLPDSLLQECLESIVALSLNKDQREIIVVDDGSETSAFNSIRNFKDDIIFIRQSNQGLSAARNAGIKMARGKFIQFVDGDDCLIPSEYEHCLDMIRHKEHIDILLFFMSKSKKTSNCFTYNGPMKGTEYMDNNNVRAAACGYIFSADRLGDLRFTTGIFHEDEEFTPLLILRMQCLYETKTKAYFYRQRKGSITHSLTKDNKNKRLEDLLGVILRLKQKVEDYDDNNKKKALNRRITQLTMDYLVNVIRLTRSKKLLNAAIEDLRKKLLYPFPNKSYTKKYICFKTLIQSKIGRYTLLKLL